MGGPYNVGMPCSISQDGTSLEFTNEKGDTVAGDFVNGETIEATGWNGLRGTLSADYKRISWANGSWWVRQIQGRITQPSTTSTEALQGGCYKDPMTGIITYVDSNGNPINTQSGSKTNQPGPSASVPRSLDECETYTSEICGTWTP